MHQLALKHIEVMRDRGMRLRAIITDMKWHLTTGAPFPEYEED